MDPVRELHDQAMELADEAHALRRQDDARWREVMGEAADLEARAAQMLAASGAEPSRSVLFRSAATMALDAGRVREAVRLAEMGLAGEQVPGELAEELREVLAAARVQLSSSYLVFERVNKGLS